MLKCSSFWLSHLGFAQFSVWWKRSEWWEPAVTSIQIWCRTQRVKPPPFHIRLAVAIVWTSCRKQSAGGKNSQKWTTWWTKSAAFQSLLPLYRAGGAAAAAVVDGWTPVGGRGQRSGSQGSLAAGSIVWTKGSSRSGAPGAATRSTNCLQRECCKKKKKRIKENKKWEAVCHWPDYWSAGHCWTSAAH